MPVKLSAVAVANAKPDPRRRVEIADTTPGLRLVVQPSGAKSWAFRYERKNGRRVKITFGPATGPGALSLADARTAAGEARKLIAQGVEPAEHRKAAEAAEAARIEAERREARSKDDVVERVLGRFYSDHVDGLRSAHDIKRLLDKEVRSVWKGRKVDEITRADAIKLIDAIKARGAAITANRVRAYTRAFFNWCIGKGLRETNPFERTKLAKVEKPRDRVLDDDEIRLISLALAHLEWPWRQFFALLLLTGQRRTEVAGMRWAELDLAGKDPVWLLPSSRTKNGREHAVPLAPSVVSTLDKESWPNDVKRRLKDECEFVFSTTGETHITGYGGAKRRLDEAMLAVAREEAEARGDDPEKVTLAEWRLHDLRRTAASGMARLGVNVAVAEKVLNHVSGTFSGVVGVYQRHDFADEKRRALTAWADHVEELTRPKESNVVSIKGAA